jgi:predicted dehydrogenase
VPVFRVGVVGYGFAGRVIHAPLIRATPGLELASIVTRDPARRRQVAAALPGVAVLASTEALWALAGTHDLVVVATPTALHADMALAALNAGLPVVVEKPLAASLADAAVMAEMSQQTGVPLVAFQNRRWDSDHLTLQHLLAQGALGRVLRYESRFERWRPTPNPAAWRESTPGPEGGGVLLDLGVHVVDQAVQLFGSVTRVYAEIDARRGGADDDVFLALEHAGGTRSHLWAGALCAAPGPRLRVLGTAAAFVEEHLDGQEAALRNGALPGSPAFGYEPPERWGRLEFGSAQDARPIRSELGCWAAFYAGIVQMLQGAPAPVRTEEALEVMAVLDAARVSATEHRVVSP